LKLNYIYKSGFFDVPMLHLEDGAVF
jgi:hypothetical protein